VPSAQDCWLRSSSLRNVHRPPNEGTSAEDGLPHPPPCCGGEDDRCSFSFLIISRAGFSSRPVASSDRDRCTRASVTGRGAAQCRCCVRADLEERLPDPCRRQHIEKALSQDGDALPFGPSAPDDSGGELLLCCAPWRMVKTLRIFRDA